MAIRARPSTALRTPLIGALAGAAALCVILAVAAPAADARTVWLCRPGVLPDPCIPGLSTTVYSPTLRPLRVIHPRPATPPPIDCFYVYPTVSQQPGTNANLHIDPEEVSIALYQAARYSQYCRVFAPMYRQLTLSAIMSPRKLTPAMLALALGDVRTAFRTYLARYNHGRGFVLIGHSQGTFVLRMLIAKDVDLKPAVRRRLLSAILLGGNVLVKRGRDVGGDFKHIPACRSRHELACVIAFSTFDGPVPAASPFGRTNIPGMQVLCTNPAALAGGSGGVTAISPSRPFAPGSAIAAGIKLLGLTQPTPPTTWVAFPGSYRARCSSAGGANVLQIAALHGAQKARPSPSARWGLHLIDANIALGNLVSIVHAEAIAFAKHRV
jgi:hypothetical protein